MLLEVERKFRIADREAFLQALAKLPADLGAAEEQVDQYFAHPSRDFGVTDEALRIRRVGEAARMTYKGPKLEATSKTREEIEIPLGGGPGFAEATGRMFERLGFRPVLIVRKQRRTADVTWRGWPVEIALDDVDTLGLFAEVEIQATAEQAESARQALASLADALGLGESERRSYLELLLASTSSRTPEGSTTPR